MKYVVALVAAILLVFVGLASILVIKVGLEAWKLGRQMKRLEEVKKWMSNRYR